MNTREIPLQDVLNAVYAGANEECEGREHAGKLTGNGHHMAQAIGASVEEELRRRGFVENTHAPRRIPLGQVLTAVYIGANAVCAEREAARTMVGNAHHMAQKISTLVEIELKRRGFMDDAEEPVVRTTVYLHGDRDSMCEQGEELGLVGDALREFTNACYEVAVELAVDFATGKSTIIAVDGHLVEPKK